MKVPGYLFFTLAVVFIIGCDSNADTPVSGTMPSSLASVDTVSIAVPAEVTISPGKAHVHIETADHQLRLIEQRVSGNTLKIFTDEDSQFKEPILIEITLPDLKSVAVAGSGRITVKHMNPEQFSAAIAGSGDIHGSGTTAELTLKIAGSGNIKMSDVKAAAVEASIAGSGNIEVRAENTLQAKIIGSGNIYVSGEASIETQVIGSGRVVNRS